MLQTLLLHDTRFIWFSSNNHILRSVVRKYQIWCPLTGSSTKLSVFIFLSSFFIYEAQGGIDWLEDMSKCGFEDVHFSYFENSLFSLVQLRKTKTDICQGPSWRTPVSGIYGPSFLWCSPDDRDSHLEVVILERYARRCCWIKSEPLWSAGLAAGLLVKVQGPLFSRMIHESWIMNHE